MKIETDSLLHHLNIHILGYVVFFPLYIFIMENGKVNHGNPGVTLALCFRVMGSYPPQAQGPERQMATEASCSYSIRPQLYLVL